MKFVIEALGLTAGGGKRGLMKLLPALADRGRRHTFVAVLADLEEFRALERPNLRLTLQKKPRSLLRRHFRLQRTIPLICAEERADALLCLGNFGPRPAPVPTVVFLHNARYVCGDPLGRRLTLRDRLITGYGKRYLRLLPQGVRLIVQTEPMKQRLVNAHRIPARRVIVIPDGDALPAASREPGPANCTKASKGKKPANGKEAVHRQGAADGGGAGSASSHGAAGLAPFTFLCLAFYYPHKNLEVLPEAIERLRHYTKRPARCFVTIHPGQHPGARRLLRRIASERLGQALVNIGSLDENEVVEAYRAADAFILPSLIESLGRTYFEAMRFNLPILTSDRDFAHEVCRGAAIYFDPLDPESIAQSMARIMEDTELRDRLAAERRLIPIPSWDEVAARFVDVLERAATEPKSCR